MTVTIDTALAELKDKPLADPDARMKPHGRELVVQEIERLRASGLRAHVLVVAHGDKLDAGAMFEKLGYDLDKDLLIVFDGYAFYGRGWGQKEISGHGPKQTTRTIADELIALLRSRAALTKSPHPSPSPSPSPLPSPSPSPVPSPSPLPRPSTTPSPTPTPTPTSDHDDGFPLLPVVGGTLLVATGGLVTLAIIRRQKLARSGLAKLDDARASLDRSYAELVLACEELPGDPQATEIQLKATELKKRMDAIVADTQAKPHTGNDPVTLGKLQQLENEIAALRSTVLQKNARGAKET
jgi:hypothetical protein